MKGLVIKNIYSIYRKNEKLIIMMLLVNALYMTMFSSFSFLSIFTMFFALALVQDQIYEDNKSGFSVYEMALPFTEKDLVFSRYLSAFTFIFLSAAASIISTLFVDFMFDFGLAVWSFTFSSLLFAYIAFVILAILLPIYYRYGIKNIRLVSIALLILPTAVNYYITKTETVVFNTDFPIYLIILLMIISLAIIAASIYSSLKIVAKPQQQS